MARQPLPLETMGAIKTTKVSAKKYVARARYRDIDGVTRQYERSGTTKTAAENALKAFLRDRTAPGLDDVTGDMRVADLAALWWEEHTSKPIANGTYRRYEQVMRLHVVDKIGAWTIREASVSKLDRFIKTLAASSYSNASIAVAILGEMFDLAARHDAVDANRVRSIARVVKPDTKPHAFSLDDVAELRSILRAWDNGLDKSGRARVSDLADPADMFLGTGCRPGEIFGFEWTSIDLAPTPATAIVQTTMAKDRAGKWVLQRQTKGRKVMRVTLPAFVTHMLFRRHVGAITSLVFPSSTGTPRIPDNFRVQWHAALKGTRFEGHTPKEFRSTVATALRDELGIQSAQYQLGHSSFATTEKSYAVPVTDAPDVSAVLERFDVFATQSGE